MINQQKIKEWVDIFIAHVEKITPEVHVEKEEGYKFVSVNNFQKYFDLSAPDLAGMLDKAIQNNNLVVGSMYFPKKMLLIFAQEYEQETREALSVLFNESVDVSKRITETQQKFDQIMVKRNKEKEELSHHYMGLRFLSLLLGFKYPNSYNAIKPREWKVFCKYINEDFNIPNRTPIGKQYEVLSEHIEALRKYIKNVPQVSELKEQLTNGLEFQDNELKWMAQNVIYVTARVLAHKRAESSGQDIKDDNQEIEVAPDSNVVVSDSMEFPLEEYLEDFMVKNWDNIDFGEKLELFIDEDGTPGQQYTTDVGIIDILAKDKKGNFVIIELKRSKSDQKVIGQILSYIGWVKENLAKSDQSVRGIVIVGEANAALLSAQRMVSDMVKVKCYKVDLSIVEPDL